ncbi:alpha/beta fold hydrolase [[Mycobacterium] crassicus]|uniref:Alpha/beta hydrolase n=1 Tax=[Mycobacterium] crassicus TaxID=2872309 RepID=A0ABU5XII2_9MYCO|nr:alpha/beta hydrolase [Mycolicibacter sp. MYC098]MEB3022102.1 alpha/beta hydrolase [Mycolicibacter sp. MYC098]
MLLHGVTMTAELSWSRVLERLGRSFRVVAPDLRGHGDGIPLDGTRFRIEDSADDIAVLAKVLGIERFTAVGYSMGGMVAQLLWRRHPQLVSGLVLCATARNVQGSWLEKLTSIYLPAMTTALYLNPFTKGATAECLDGSLLGQIHDGSTRAWARAQLSRTSLPAAMSAVESAVEFTSHEWIAEVDVPTAVLIPTADQLVPPSRQHRLARAIPHAKVFELPGDHTIFLNDPACFGEVLVAATRSVTSQNSHCSAQRNNLIFEPDRSRSALR